MGDRLTPPPLLLLERRHVTDVHGLSHRHSLFLQDDENLIIYSKNVDSSYLMARRSKQRISQQEGRELDSKGTAQGDEGRSINSNCEDRELDSEGRRINGKGLCRRRAWNLQSYLRGRRRRVLGNYMYENWPVGTNVLR